ncbi:uncharacterized protein LOC113486928 [Athene cunicularia]|uniref:uncharacterized protein LOC113486928 n=1 Tax=Athene cunicularia TaxID=194338 RepID=UPI000EF73C36|nr:uncharacterized protein LOC113486928 [Athene cunicularia]
MFCDSFSSGRAGGRLPGDADLGAVSASPLSPSQHDEIELLGQDGHIYRGQRGEQLPVLVGKEGPSPSCPRGSGTPGTPAACSPGPRVLGPHLASQAPPPHQRPAQPHPTATPPRNGSSSSPWTDPAPRKPGRTGGPRLNPHHIVHQAGEEASLASINKGRWAAKHLRGLSGVALGRDLPIMHKEGSQHPLSCSHRRPEELKPAPVQPPSRRLCQPRAATLPLTSPGLHDPLFGSDGPWHGARGPQKGLGEPTLKQEEDYAPLLLKVVGDVGTVVGDGDRSGKGGSRTWLHAKSQSHPKPAGLLLLILRDEHH